MSSPSLGDRARQRAAALSERALAVPGAGLILRVLRDLAVSDITDRAMTLAAQAFTAVLPMVILLAAFPDSDLVSDALGDLGISGDQVDVTDATTPDSVTAFGLLGALMVIGGATSLSRAMGRMYTSIWQVTKLPLSGWWRWVVVILLLPVGVVAQGFAANLHGINLIGVTFGAYGVLGVILEVLATFVIWSLMFTLLPRLLVSGQVPMRLLALSGVVTGVFITVFLVGTRIALPRILKETTQHFGTLGLVFAAISWLFFFAGIVVVCTIVIHSLTCDTGRVGTWIRQRFGTPAPFPPRPEALDDLLEARPSPSSNG
ncbi:MAG: YhjD/YihY/BrkB family envelope integrity protein [Actinomycetota bacterium]|nr:YhjD/YihY/BrkB family envelope integrity protein [Actinomycetota bacterium]